MLFSDYNQSNVFGWEALVCGRLQEIPANWIYRILVLSYLLGLEIEMSQRRVWLLWSVLTAIGMVSWQGQNVLRKETKL